MSEDNQDENVSQESGYPQDDEDGAINFDDFRQQNEPKSVEATIATTMANFAPKEANYAISHKLIPPVAALEELEIRWLDWVSIPEGMNTQIVSDRMFFTNVFEKAIRFSASRKGMGRDQIAEVLSSYFSQGASKMGVMERIKQRLMPKDIE